MVPHWIAGERVEEAAAETVGVTESATGRVVGRVPAGGGEAADRAVRAARAAFGEWRHASLGRRKTTMFAYRELLNARRDELVDLLVTEHGKVADDAAGEVQRGLEVVEYACGIPDLLKGEHTENVSTNVDSWSVRQPVGVMAGITPFNFPVMVPLWMLPIAIACGNAFVLKPSEKDPSASLRLAELAHEAGVPPGVVGVVQGTGEAAQTLLTHPEVDGVSFVGSTPVARHVQRTAVEHGKRVQALGGAKNHAVVLPDADLDVTADALVGAAYGSAGERCMAISAAVAVGGVGDALAPAITERLKGLEVAAGTNPDAHMGPLITAEHRDRVAGYLAAGVAEGATLAYDGRDHPIDGDDGGHWLGPSLFDHVTPGMTVYTDEIFGPVLVLLRADSFEEAIDLVNRNRWGNGTAIFTNDGGAARRFHHEVEVGMVGVNVPIPVPMAYHSFGGWKESLFGDLHIHGPEGVQFNTRGKVVTSRWPDPTERGIDRGFPTAR
ncbi:CoA-acylating methylmalonate-semialdehyde dehydrogenase [Egibacter rhizosphaerae]|uniref:methylmalonate-semialdehyde dehydrogenase (CoA acylating) n=2 Tax=Egibacter rhizosphaerae TaxID=1670831 RepID=A0A411YL65_9ACTN|nr:CoA-acylating methylmalonate-semialdehyde dehydrogenase [Egibacter rhizosphaerae]